MNFIRNYITSILFIIIAVIFVGLNLVGEANWLFIVGIVVSLVGLLLSIIFLRSWIHEFSYLKESAMLDGLTGVLNQKVYKDRLAEEIRRARRYDKRLSIFFMDIDKFKVINDNFGHVFGDFVIKETARIIKSNLRNFDVVSRYGGEEFSTVLINSRKRDTRNTAERIRKTIESHVFSSNGLKTSITISIGISEYPEDGEEVRDLIRNADGAMYSAKKEGGNTVKP